jgi:uroporphyrinogen-III decarboxylase
MDNSTDTVKKAFEHRFAERIPRGELWLGTDLLKKARLEDSLDGHLSLIKRLDHDILCLPLSTTRDVNKTLGYRYFTLKDLEKASQMDDVFVMAIIDGPFQRLVEKRGLMKVLSGWTRERDEVTAAYERERAGVDMLIKQCLEQSVDAVVIADDVAGERSLFVAPEEMHGLFSPFYAEAVSEIHSAHAYALLHSCGNITMFVPYLVSYGFDGLAAIQHRANDLFSLKGQYGSRLILMAGIEAEMLEAGEMSLSMVEEYQRLIRSLVADGGFILCSSSGLNSGDFLERIQELYQIADKLFNSRP